MKYTSQRLLLLSPAVETLDPHPSIVGLFLRVRPLRDGRYSRVWVWKRMVLGKRRSLAYADFPSRSIDDAVRWAEELNRIAADGHDPVEYQIEQERLAKAAQAEQERLDSEALVAAAARPTVRDAWNDYLAACRRRGVASMKQKMGIMEKDFMQIEGGKYLADLTKKDCRDAIARCEARGVGPNRNLRQGNRLRCEMIALLNWCVRNDVDGLTANGGIDRKERSPTR